MKLYGRTLVNSPVEGHAKRFAEGMAAHSIASAARRLSWADTGKQCLQIAAGLAPVLSQIRQRPSIGQSFALGLAIANSASQIQDLFRRPISFTDEASEALGGPSIFVTNALVKLLHIELQDSRLVRRAFGSELYIGSFHGVQMAQLQTHSGPNDLSVNGEASWMMLQSQTDEMSAVVKKRIRDVYGACLTISDGNLIPTKTLVDAYKYKSGIEEAVGARIRKFAEKGVSRSYLLHGYPGTGKTTFAAWMAQQVGETVFILPATRYSQLTGSPQPAGLGSLELMKLFDAEAIIFDDIDRAEPEATFALMTILEQKSPTRKIVIATCNDLDSLDPALLRAGRFDEIISVPAILPETIQKMIAPDEFLASKFVGWPIAYVEEWVRRRNVLGTETAALEIEELRTRWSSEEVRADSLYKRRNGLRNGLTSIENLPLEAAGLATGLGSG